jgi:hypothetical protein
LLPSAGSTAQTGTGAVLSLAFLGMTCSLPFLLHGTDLSAVLLLRELLRMILVEWRAARGGRDPAWSLSLAHEENALPASASGSLLSPSLLEPPRKPQPARRRKINPYLPTEYAQSTSPRKKQARALPPAPVGAPVVIDLEAEDEDEKVPLEPLSTDGDVLTPGPSSARPAAGAASSVPPTAALSSSPRATPPDLGYLARCSSALDISLLRHPPPSAAARPNSAPAHTAERSAD